MTKLVLALSLVVTALAPQNREPARLPTGSAVLTGTVTSDEPNGQPVRRALVTATINGDLRQQSQTATDDRGRFTLAALPPGTVRLVVSKPGFVTTYYGATQPGSTVARPIALATDQKVDVSIRLPRGAVITGTISDQSGQLMAGVSVRLQRVATSATGQRVLMPAAGPAPAPTDDRGEYRVFGLAAGDYIVMAQPRLGGSPSMNEVRPTTDAEVRWAEQQLRTGGPAAAPGRPADALPRGQTMTFANVYYPSTASAASASIVAVTAGQERRGIDLRMQFVPTARVEGAVTSADGAPARGVQVILIPDADAANLEAERFMIMMEVGLVAGSMSPATRADGTFSIQSVEPGGYVVLARTAPPGRAGGPAIFGWAMTDVRVDGRDVTGVAMRLAPGQSISGRVIFDGKATPPGQISVSLRPVGARGLGVTGSRPVEGPERAFAVEGLIPSPYRISATATGWALKSAMVGGRDAADAPFEVKAGENIADAVLTFTDTTAEISGVLYDAAGRANGDMSIVLFSTTPAHWFTGSRRVPAARPATDGRFTFTGLAAGEDHLAALTDVTPADLNSPQFLELVMPAAIRIAIGDGEKKTQDLRIK